MSIFARTSLQYQHILARSECPDTCKCGMEVLNHRLSTPTQNCWQSSTFGQCHTYIYTESGMLCSPGLPFLFSLQICDIRMPTCYAVDAPRGVAQGTSTRAYPAI